MEKEIYFECDCGGKAKTKIFDLCDEENVFDAGLLAQCKFICEECGKTYYTGDWECFCLSEDEL